MSLLSEIEHGCSWKELHVIHIHCMSLAKLTRNLIIIFAGANFHRSAGYIFVIVIFHMEAMSINQAHLKVCRYSHGKNLEILPHVKNFTIRSVPYKFTITQIFNLRSSSYYITPCTCARGKYLSSVVISTKIANLDLGVWATHKCT